MRIDDFSPIQKFQHSISGIGLFPPVTVVADGERQTFDTKIQGKENQAWYKLNPDLQTGYFGFVGISVRWDFADSKARLTTKPRWA
ncbi:hypothetical protein [Limnohabitans sp. 2KL-27]|uniref:hypothetical protein n=1 Tax=Limnohabitans sp. 2KL-27 TaxID=1100705 RepID=UPI000ABDB3CD|nr:hypothetical protein [Limnohabitans sp. 2KL-27]